MTAQEIFDTVLAHLRKQGEAAKSYEGECVYRGPDGTSCAVGCLIPDELYDPLIEGLSAYEIMTGSRPQHDQCEWAEAMALVTTRIAKHIGVEHSPLLEELQIAHDSHLAGKGITAWECKMQATAENFDLAYTPAGPRTSDRRAT